MYLLTSVIDHLDIRYCMARLRSWNPVTEVIQLKVLDTSLVFYPVLVDFGI